MSEKLQKNPSGAGVSAPNKMRLYATWVDRTPSNCIPRLCSLTLTRLVILKPLGTDLASISIAVKMQSSKRTLRSNEILLNSNGLLDTALDLTFCLQYPHFLKREGNRLHILLQRRKRYKNRTMLGFKTLAEGIIRMDQVLQKQMDLELELLPENSKEKNSHPIARISILQISSTPVDQEQNKTDRDHDFSDDDDEISSGEEEAGDLSDSEPIRSKLPHTRHNLKQRFVSLLRRFRVADSEGGRDADLSNPSDIQALFNELESLSCDDDSGNEQDTMSISSTPKPSLRPFFSSSKSLLDSNVINPNVVLSGGGGLAIGDFDKSIDDRTCSGGSDANADVYYTDPEGLSDPQTGSPPKEQTIAPPQSRLSTTTTITKSVGDGGSDFSNLMQEISERKSKLFRTSASSAKKKNSLSVSSDVTPTIQEATTPRKTFLELISRLLPLEETTLPDTVVFVMGPENIITNLIVRLTQYRVFQPLNSSEVKAVLTAIFNKIHKHCNTCAKPTPFIKLVIIGGDILIGWLIRPYVELLSSKPSEWLNFTRIYLIPLGQCGLAKYLSQQDQGYATLFPQEQDLKPDDLLHRLQRYLSVPNTAPIAQLPIGETMLTCQDDSSQIFIPFINEVRVGPAEHSLSVSVDLEDLMCSSSSPPAPSLTPPSSPNVQTRESPWEPLELQLDYWQLMQAKCTESLLKTDKTTKQDSGKTSLKGLFRGLQATPSSIQGLTLAIHLATKEKKQKIMRLGKKKEKERDSEPRTQTIDGISRLICSAKASHNTPMKVYIDGVEFNGVKFFQLSSTWQTHVKHLSIALVGVPLASVEVNSM